MYYHARTGKKDQDAVVTTAVSTEPWWKASWIPFRQIAHEDMKRYDENQLQMTTLLNELDVFENRR
jgi:hypothetical protein